MKYGYARVSTDGQSVDAQVRQLTKADCKKVFRGVASGAKTDRAQLRRLLGVLDAGDVADGDAARPAGAIHPRPVEHARGDRRSESCFRSLGDAWVDTTTSHGRLMLTVLGELAEFERDLDPRPHQQGPRARQGARRQAWPETETDRTSEARGDPPSRP
jgi:DNA invertase Pin-like site-specific DNA recombinase